MADHHIPLKVEGDRVTGVNEFERDVMSPARISAAAPDLLAALRGVLLGSPSETALAELVGEDVVREARAAIAKATGGQP